MSGQWPPEWEDSDTGLPDEWTDSDAALDPEASEVSLFLASVPSPMLPASFEARISAAIAAEATARADGTASAGTRSAGTDPAGTDPAGADSAGAESAGTGFAGAELDGTGSAGAGIAAAGTGDAKATDRSSSQEVSPTAAESGPATAARHRRRRTSAASRSAAAKSRPAVRPGGSRPDGRRRRFQLPSSRLTATLVVFLVIAGFAVVFTQIGGGSGTYSGTDSSGISAQGAASSSASSRHAAALGPNVGSVPYKSDMSGAAGQFPVTESGTRYQGSTLARQVQEQLNALVTPTAAVPSPSAPNSASATAEPAGSASATAASSASASAAAGAAPRGLAGCVTHLTKGVAPALVDQATYDGIPAYIIATASRVWVVRRGCTAADPQQITSVSLSG